MSQSPTDLELTLDTTAPSSAENSVTTQPNDSSQATEAASAAPVETDKAEQQRVRASRLLRAVRAELEKALIGQSAVIEGVLCSLIASGHVLIEGLV